MLENLLEMVGIFFVIMYGFMPLVVLKLNKLPARYKLVSVPEDEFNAESVEAFKDYEAEIRANDIASKVIKLNDIENGLNKT